jgi:hypothetical protein
VQGSLAVYSDWGYCHLKTDGFIVVRKLNNLNRCGAKTIRLFLSVPQSSLPSINIEVVAEKK